MIARGGVEVIIGLLIEEFGDVDAAFAIVAGYRLAFARDVPFADVALEILNAGAESFRAWRAAKMDREVGLGPTTIAKEPS